MAATASIAKSAANSINFFIFSYLRLWNLTNLHKLLHPTPASTILQKDDFGRPKG
jgi:hypothetical protein